MEGRRPQEDLLRILEFLEVLGLEEMVVPIHLYNRGLEEEAVVATTVEAGVREMQREVEDPLTVVRLVF